MKNEPHRPEDSTVETDIRAAGAGRSPVQANDIVSAGAGPGQLVEGARFGVYALGACIGQGGMARVYRAEHEGLQRQVALKVLIDGVGHDGEGHERFLREARLAAAIKHPNVVNIFDVGVCDGTPYLVMELLEGVDLDALVESQGKLDEATIVDVIVPIVAGLAAVHEAGIVHRDLKPGNIFLARGRNDELEPKLLDFGISKSIGPDQMKLTSARGMMIGTPFYMSPEAARGAEVTALSDQYALGVVMYECATGVNPFSGANNFGEVVSRVSTGSFEPLANKETTISKRLVAIIERAMQVDPDRRFPDMRAMGRELLQLAGQRTRITWDLTFGDISGAGHAGLARHDVNGLEDAVRPSRSGKLRGLLSAALVTALVLGGVWLFQAPNAEEAVEHADEAEAPALASAMALRPPQPPAERNNDKADPSADAVAIPIAHAIDSAHELPSEPVGSTSPIGETDEQQAAPMSRAKSRAEGKPQRRTLAERKLRRPVEARVSEDVPPPEWVPAAPSEHASNASNTGRGTNNAPILD